MFEHWNHKVLTKGWIFIVKRFNTKHLPLSFVLGKYNFQPYEGIDFYCYNSDIEKNVWFHFRIGTLNNLLGVATKMYWALLISIQTLII